MMKEPVQSEQNEITNEKMNYAGNEMIHQRNQIAALLTIASHRIARLRENPTTSFFYRKFGVILFAAQKSNEQ